MMILSYKKSAFNSENSEYESDDNSELKKIEKEDHADDFQPFEEQGVSTNIVNINRVS